jgi:cytochrome P450
MLRAFRTIRGNPLGYLEDTWRRHGDIVQFPIPRPPSYLVNEPGAVRRVLVDQARNYTKSTIQYRALSLVTGEGLLTVDEPDWKRQRRLVQPAFHHQTLALLTGHVEAATAGIAQEWRGLAAGSGASDQSDGSVVDVDEAMMHGALEVVGHALFGTDLSTDAAALAGATLDALDVVIARARVPITPPAWMPTPANRRLARANHILDVSVARMITDRRGRGTASHDMLDLLMEVRDEDGGGLTTDEIRNQMVTFIVAGHETVASALTWAWALLAEHPDVLQQLRIELDAVVGPEPLTIEDYQQLPYTRAVFDEVLRLYPPAWLITRRATEADELGGHVVPAGALIIMSPWLLHRHRDLWADPEEFRPSRFIDEQVDRSAFIPFGAGPRMCIGRDFAYVEGVLMLARLAAEFTLTYPEGAGLPAANPLVTIRPTGGLQLRVSPRE